MLWFHVAWRRLRTTKARDIPLLGFEVNTFGTVNLLEAIERIEQMTGNKLDWRYVEETRKGNHICYISNISKFRSHYPEWSLTRRVDDMIDEMVRLEDQHGHRSAQQISTVARTVPFRSREVKAK